MVEQVKGLGLAELQGYGQEWESHSFLPQGQQFEGPPGAPGEAINSIICRLVRKGVNHEPY